MRISFAFIFSAGFTVATVWAAQPPGERGNDKHAKGEGAAKAHIVLEEVEISLMDGDAVSRSMRTAAQSSQAKMAIAEAREKVFKRLGVRSMAEIRERKLGDRFNSEMASSARTRKLEQPVLQFLDETGKAAKSIPLSPRKSRGKVKVDYKDETWDSEIETTDIPRVSKNGDFAVLVARKIEHVTPSKEYREKSFAEAAREHSEISLVDAHGKELFRKEVEKGRWIAGGPQPQVAVSDNGTFAFLTGEGEGPGREILYAYDKEGKLLLSFPDDATKAHPQGDISMSSNGRFLAIAAGYAGEGARLVFFDLTTGKSWKAEKPYAVMDMGDDGRVKLAFGRENLEIDLQQRLER